MEHLISTPLTGIVIPCYNEERLLLSKAMDAFIKEAAGCHICFVNDGSTDTTAEVLKALQRGNENRISICTLDANSGTGEAVRVGMLEMANKGSFDKLAYISAGIIPDFNVFLQLSRKMNNPEYEMVSISKASLTGDLYKRSLGGYFSKVLNHFTRNAVGTEFRDTQTGIRIMTPGLVKATMQKKFLTNWFFNVEVAMRMKNMSDENSGKELVAEIPVYRLHTDVKEKITLKDSFRIAGDIRQLAVNYR